MISSTYKELGIIAEVKEAFKNTGILLLPEFLNEGFYNKILLDVKQKGEKIYAPAKLSFNKLKIKGAVSFFKSKEFKSFIKIVTGKSADKSEIEVLKFSHKDFTLLHDDFNYSEDFDIYFFILENEWDSSWGGNLIYSGKETRLVTPQPNSLVLVNRKKDMQSFFKYINNFAGKENFVVVKFRFC